MASTPRVNLLQPWAYPRQEPGLIKPNSRSAAGREYRPDDYMRSELMWREMPIILDEYGDTFLPVVPNDPWRTTVTPEPSNPWQTVVKPTRQR
jgi:hypothetical protein